MGINGTADGLTDTAKDKFSKDAKKLDEALLKEFPALNAPATRIVIKYDLNDVISKENTYRFNFNTILLNAFRSGIAQAFKYIAIGEGGAV